MNVIYINDIFYMWTFIILLSKYVKENKCTATSYLD